MPDKKEYAAIIRYGTWSLITLLITVHSIFIYHYMSVQEFDNARINIAGRLRMLTQKIAKDLLLYRDGAIGKNDVEKDIRFFSDSISAITYGGTVFTDLSRQSMINLKKKGDPADHALFLRAIALWKPFMYHATHYLDEKNPVSLNYVLGNNEELTIAIDRCVTSIYLHADDDETDLGIVIMSAMLLIIAGTIAAFVSQLKKFRATAARLKSVESLLPICSGCKKIRTDDAHPGSPASWTSIEIFLKEKNDMLFTHSLCPDCARTIYPEYKLYEKK